MDEDSEDTERILADLQGKLRGLAGDLTDLERTLAETFERGGANAGPAAREWALDQVMCMALYAEANQSAANGEFDDAHEKLRMAEFYRDRDPDGWTRYVSWPKPGEWP
ncbi:MAG: hypothetical protein ACRDSE_11565 [Pseudonocardiaceae bacterium]